MDVLRWSDNLSIGVSLIDDQHKTLIEIYNELYGAIMDGVSNKRIVMPILDELLQHTRYHFDTEENLMKEQGYSLTSLHESEHYAFIDEIELYKTTVINGAVIQVVSVKTKNLLKGWLNEHINGTDKKMGEFLNSKGIT